MFVPVTTNTAITLGGSANHRPEPDQAGWHLGVVLVTGNATYQGT